MKIILVDSEFQDMANAWVYKNLVEKELVRASVVDNVIELEVIGEGEQPPIATPDWSQTPEVFASKDETDES